ncbi:MAG: hypothetical protein AB7I41_22560 [Candidatus Sericytochromatia bacterium]
MGNINKLPANIISSTPPKTEIIGSSIILTSTNASQKVDTETKIAPDKLDVSQSKSDWGKTAKTVASKLAGKAIEESLHVGMRVGVQYASNRLSQQVIGGASKEIVGGTSAKVVGMLGAKASSRLSSAVPYVAATVVAGFAVLDVKNAIELSKDQNVSGVSKALAWTTVGMDAISVVTTATNKGATLGWVAIGLGIGSSVLSEILK